MASEVRVNTIQNRSGLGTVTFNDSGIVVQGSIGVGTFTTAQRNAGVGTAIGALVYNSTVNQLQVYSPAGWIVGAREPFSATGGTLDTTSRSGYKIHTFTSPGTFTVTGTPATVEYLVVAGGGGAAAQTTVGGGGAGGFRSGTLAVFPGDYTVTRGGGGAGGPWDTDGSKGANSVFGPITATGGGFGGADETQGGPGGSGGGSGGSSGGALAGGPGNEGGYTPVEGYDGGPNKPARTAPYTSGGGGGADGAGVGGATNAGPGGPGATSSITGSPVTYAGGGGGASSVYGGTNGTGGAGGGGGGVQGANGTDGTANTGGGGGGSSHPGSGFTGGSGGSGIIIIAYPTS